MGRIGIWELAIIVILFIVIFGARRLPELGKGLGQGLASFRQAMRDTNQPADQRGPKAEADSCDRA